MAYIRMIIGVLIAIGVLAGMPAGVQAQSEDGLVAASDEYLVESYHPYANNLDYTWPPITELGATQMRLHFTKLYLESADDLILLDNDGKELKEYDGYWKRYQPDDMWTEWFTGDTIRVKLITDGIGTEYGFQIDETETRTNMAPSTALPESYHPYANNFQYTWPPITELGATQMRLHFTKLYLESGDDLILLDNDGKELKEYDGYWKRYQPDDMWTEWFTGDTIRVKLITDGKGTEYGFQIDHIETRGTIKPTDVPTDTSVSPTETITSTSTSQLHPTPTPEGSASSASHVQPSVTTASVNLHGEKTDVVLGEDVLLKLSAVNIIGNPTMHVQVIIIPPSGWSVTSSEFAKSGAGQYTTTYELESGGGKDIEVRIVPNQIGDDFQVEGRIIYYFGDDVSTREDHTLSLPIKVRAESDGPTHPLQPTESTPGFVALVAFSLILLIWYLRNRSDEYE